MKLNFRAAQHEQLAQILLKTGSMREVEAWDVRHGRCSFRLHHEQRNLFTKRYSSEH